MSERAPARADLTAAAVAVGLLAAAAVTGAVLNALGHPVRATTAPLTGRWWPHLGPGTPLALAVAALVVSAGPALAARLPWRPLLAASYLTAVSWILALALIDGWGRGVAGRLTTRFEYLHEVPGVTSIPAMLRGFTTRILDFQPDSWTTHVAGHPPGALLVFVWLDRLGLGGGAWAGLLCVLAGAVTAVAVPHTVRTLGTEEAARAPVPFLALFPGAVWIGVSADGLFAGITSAGVALLAVAVTRAAAFPALAGGALLGFGCYLSYGLVLMAPVVAAVVMLGSRRRAAWWAAAGAAAVAAAFTVAGFDWLTGYHLVVRRYYQGVAAHRPYTYWVWADLALLTVSTGPAAAAILRRATARTAPTSSSRPSIHPLPPAQASSPQHTAQPSSSAWLFSSWRGARSLSSTRVFWLRQGVRPLSSSAAFSSWLGVWSLSLARAFSARCGVWLLPLAAAGAILAADVSGYSKAEVERIWLPFGVWLLAGAGLLPARHRRLWLLGQAGTALLINHLLLTTW